MEEILSPEQWNELQIMLKIKFPELSDEDLQYHESYETDLLRMVGYCIKRDVVTMQGIFYQRLPHSPPVVRIGGRAPAFNMRDKMLLK